MCSIKQAVVATWQFKILLKGKITWITILLNIYLSVCKFKFLQFAYAMGLKENTFHLDWIWFSRIMDRSINDLNCSFQLQKDHSTDWTYQHRFTNVYSLESHILEMFQLADLGEGGGEQFGSWLSKKKHNKTQKTSWSSKKKKDWHLVLCRDNERIKVCRDNKCVKLNAYLQCSVAADCLICLSKHRKKADSLVLTSNTSAL